MLLVYADKITSRLKYIVEVLFNNILGQETKLTNDLIVFRDHPSVKINYSNKNINGSICIIPAGLLFEQEIREQDIKVFRWQDLPVFYANDKDELLPFDPLAMAFYLLSRYEEYLPHEKDNHGRYKPENSLAFREGFLEIPLINIIAHKLSDILHQTYPDFGDTPRNYEFIPTIDIDMAFAHLGKSIVRSIGGTAKLILKFKFKDVSEKFSVLLGFKPDPFDNFAFQLDIFKQHRLDPRYFVLLGDYGSFDKNSSHLNKRFRTLLKHLSEFGELGIHPSYEANDKEFVIKKEISRLEEIIDKQVVSSRQHFLRINFPSTFRSLHTCGIQHDFSMGYASRIGFRASICTSFNFYDLHKESILPILIHPFAFMDTTLRDYMKLNANEYVKFVEPLIENVKRVKGQLIGIWHNYSMADDQDELKAFSDIVKLTSQ